MPTYEYTCTNCKHTWECEHSIKDAPLEFCVECGEKTAKRLISQTSFTLGGGGWAREGYVKGSDPTPT